MAASDAGRKTHAQPSEGLKNAFSSAAVERARPAKDQCALQASIYDVVAEVVPPTVMLKPSLAIRILPVMLSRVVISRCHAASSSIRCSSG